MKFSYYLYILIYKISVMKLFNFIKRLTINYNVAWIVFSSMIMQPISNLCRTWLHAHGDTPTARLHNMFFPVDICIGGIVFGRLSQCSLQHVYCCSMKISAPQWNSHWGCWTDIFFNSENLQTAEVHLVLNSCWYFGLLLHVNSVNLPSYSSMSYRFTYKKLFTMKY